MYTTSGGSSGSNSHNVPTTTAVNDPTPVTLTTVRSPSRSVCGATCWPSGGHSSSPIVARRGGALNQLTHAAAASCCRVNLPDASCVGIGRSPYKSMRRFDPHRPHVRTFVVCHERVTRKLGDRVDVRSDSDTEVPLVAGLPTGPVRDRIPSGVCSPGANAPPDEVSDGVGQRAPSP